jgi:glutamate-1-semialdehyde 2,1-aminomutase
VAVSLKAPCVGRPPIASHAATLAPERFRVHECTTHRGRYHRRVAEDSVPTGAAQSAGRAWQPTTTAASLQARAERVIAGAAGRKRLHLYRFLAEYPWYVDSGEGATITDVDGRSYIDLMGSYGPNLLGHGHPRVEQAATRQRLRGDSMGAQAPVAVELAEFLSARFEPVDWVFVGKNGSDATSYALRVARLATGRSRVLIAEAAYHTAHDWGTIFEAGVPAPHSSLTSRFVYNDAESLRAAVDAADGDVAAIMLTPFHQGYFATPVLPTESFLNAVRSQARQSGAVVVLDDVRAGMRMHPSGGSYAEIGLEPDLVCFAKAVANGRALSVCGGSAELRDAADQVGYLGTFFASAVAQAACLATFRAFDIEGSFERMMTIGGRLVTGLVEAAARADLTIDVNGFPTMAMVSIEGDDPGRYLSHVWSAAMVRRGVLVHPTQPWYLCAALTDEQVDTVLERAADCFDDVAEEIANPRFRGVPPTATAEVSAGPIGGRA